jgi:hypothetical protein
MTKKQLFLTVAYLVAVLSTLPIATNCFDDCFDFDCKVECGPTFEYTRFTQGCLPYQSGMMIGPVGVIDLEHACGIDWYMRFKGLYDIPYICSNNGLTVDAREYEVNGHLGYQINNNDCCFSLTPFTGIDFIYLRHEITCNIIRNRYYQVNVPFGLDFIYQLSDSVNWGIKLWYDLDAWTRLKVSTPNLCDSAETKIELKRGDRVSLEMPLNWNFSVCDWCCSLNFTFLFSWQKFGCEKCPTELNIPVLEKWHVGSIATFGIEF